MSKKLLKIFAVVFAFGGILLLAYPYIGFWLSKREQSYAIAEYDEVLEKAEAEELRAIREAAEAYNAGLPLGMIADPFTQSPGNEDTTYYTLLKVPGHELMCYIDIPKIKLHLPVYHGTEVETLQKGIGHLEGSALPVGGAGNHSILTGHTGVKSSVLFTNLTELDYGDEFFIYVLDEVLAYRVDRIAVIEPSDTDRIKTEPSKDYVTLVTCTPYGVNSHRLLVRGVRVPYTAEEIVQRIDETPQVTDWMTSVFIAVSGGFWIALFGILIKRRSIKTKQ